jgi:hypothetical protein
MKVYVGRVVKLHFLNTSLDYSRFISVKTAEYAWKQVACVQKWSERDIERKNPCLESTVIRRIHG